MDEIFAIISRLRDAENGCPWDCAQTLSSMLKPLRNEVEELAQAIESGETDAIREEAGDVLWNILFMLHVAAGEKLFSPDDVAQTLQEKMVSRHPHVFGDRKASTPEEAKAFYEAAKRQAARKE
jgi:uncharacterized protein YabN with tetrapyrrole methylase and pyrophosphatase domain